MTEKNPEAAEGQAAAAAGEKDGAQERPGRSFHDFHMLLFRAFHAQRNLLSPYVKRLGLGNGQPKILSYLAVKGPSTQRDLAEFYEIDAAAVSRMLDALERSGFITATASATDRRSKTIALTEQGIAAVNAWDAACVEEEISRLGSARRSPTTLTACTATSEPTAANSLPSAASRPSGAMPDDRAQAYSELSRPVPPRRSHGRAARGGGERL